jgi:hypothetical protein
VNRRVGGAIFWTSTGLAALALVLVVVNAALTLANRSAQTEVNARQQFINANLQLSRVSETLIRTVAAVAANKNDDTLRILLAQHGITYTVNQNPSGSAGAAVAPYATPAQEAPK